MNVITGREVFKILRFLIIILHSETSLIRITDTVVIIDVYFVPRRIPGVSCRLVFVLLLVQYR